MMLCAAAWAGAEEPPAAGPLADVEVGFSGTHRVGCWTPVRITLKAAAEPLRGRLDAEVIDGDGLPVRYAPLNDAEISVAAGSSQQATVYVRFGRTRAGLLVRWKPANGPAVERRTDVPEIPAALATEPSHALCLGEDFGLSEADQRAGRGAGRQAVLLLEEPNSLPLHACGYDGVDMILLATPPGGVLEQMSAPQQQALLAWVRGGGRLFVSCGSRGAELFGPEGRLAPLAPGPLQRVTPLRQTTGLEAFAASPEPLLGGTVELAWFEPGEGVVEVVEGVGAENRPVILRRAFGFGEVILAAIDLDRGPAAEWSGRPRLLAKLLWPEEGGEAAEDSGPRGQVSHLGYDDLAGQLRGALDRFPEAQPTPFSWVAGLIGVYLLLIGPIDYLLLRRFAGRFEWTWLTFPPVVLAALGLALVLGNLWRSSNIAGNQVDLIDINTASGEVRGTSWLHLYSPQTRRFDLALAPPSIGTPPADTEDATAALLFAWQGLPGAGLGGMASTASPAPVAEAYAIEPSAPEQLAIRGLPILTGSTKSLSARWRRNVPASEETLRWEVNELQGEFTNPLPYDLSECWLYYDRWAWPIERGLAAGEVFNAAVLPPPRNLEWQLVRFRILDSKDVSTPWDRSDLTNIPRILEMMMFHQAARGTSYTHLAHRYHGDLDWSALVKLDRAVLVGRPSAEAAAELRVRRAGTEEEEEAQTQRWTFCRLVIPVTTPANGP